MTMLKSFNLKGNKLNFADWISNLSPTETPFISMISKEKVNQTMYQWQTDRLTQPGKQAANPTANAGSDPSEDDIALDANYNKEGSEAVMENRFHTTVHSNFTQIYRKAVRVTDTTKKIALYGRSSELTYQMEKAGLEIKRDLEYSLLNSTEEGRPGTAADHGICAGVQKLIAPIQQPDKDTGAIVNRMVNYVDGQVPFTKKNVFDLTLDLYLVGARCNKIMFHPMHMAIFSDWIGDANGSKLQAAQRRPHLHRMFDGLDDKYNAFVKKIRDPLGQEFTLIPNRHMPANKLFFFNESDWTQMVLREPEKILLAKLGSSEKYLIEMEVGLRHRNPFASGMLTLVKTAKNYLGDIRMDPTTSPKATNGDTLVESSVSVKVFDAHGETKGVTEGVTFEVQTINDDTKVTDVATQTADGTTVDGVAKAKVKHKKASRVKVSAKITTAANATDFTQGISTAADFYDSRG